MLGPGMETPDTASLAQSSLRPQPQLVTLTHTPHSSGTWIFEYFILRGVNAEKNGKETPINYNPVDHLLIFTHFFGGDRSDSTLVKLPG